MNIRNRVKEFRLVEACKLRPNPYNWRIHPEAQQNALRGLLAEVGFCGAVLARELENGDLELIDGHLRAETAPHTEVPVLVLDVTAAESKLILATFDTITEMADPDGEELEKLLAEIEPESDAVQAMLDELCAESGIDPPAFDPASIDEQGKLDEKAPVVCPNCKYAFTP